MLAGTHPVDDNPHRMSQYAKHMSKFDVPSLHVPVPLSSVGYFASGNNMFINVHGVDDDRKVIYPLRFSSTLVSDRHVCNDSVTFLQLDGSFRNIIRCTIGMC